MKKRQCNLEDVNGGALDFDDTITITTVNRKPVLSKYFMSKCIFLATMCRKLDFYFEYYINKSRLLGMKHMEFQSPRISLILIFNLNQGLRKLKNNTES